jgi:hypothetical protein
VDRGGNRVDAVPNELAPVEGGARRWCLPLVAAVPFDAPRPLFFLACPCLPHPHRTTDRFKSRARLLTLALLPGYTHTSHLPRKAREGGSDERTARAMAAPAPRQEELQPHAVKDQLPAVSYCPTSPPPWRTPPSTGGQRIGTLVGSLPGADAGGPLMPWSNATARI